MVKSRPIYSSQHIHVFSVKLEAAFIELAIKWRSELKFRPRIEAMVEAKAFRNIKGKQLSLKTFLRNIATLDGGHLRTRKRTIFPRCCTLYYVRTITMWKPIQKRIIFISFKTDSPLYKWLTLFQLKWSTLHKTRWRWQILCDTNVFA